MLNVLHWITRDSKTYESLDFLMQCGLAKTSHVMYIYLETAVAAKNRAMSSSNEVINMFWALGLPPHSPNGSQGAFHFSFAQCVHTRVERSLPPNEVWGIIRKGQFHLVYLFRRTYVTRPHQHCFRSWTVLDRVTPSSGAQLFSWLATSGTIIKNET